MNYKKVIPCLDICNGRVVKGVNFVDFKDAGDPAEIADFYCKSNADELVFLDITATYENRDTLISVIENAAKKVTIPLTVGGGIRTVEDARKVLNAGATKVSINSAAIKTPELICKLSKEFGKNAVVVAIDVKKNEDGVYKVVINGGHELTDIDAVPWAKKVEELGAGAILLTSMDRDGMKNGFDLEITKQISQSVEIPVTASGGAGELVHFLEVINEGGASNVLSASLFHFKEFEINQVKQYLKDNGVSVRI